MDDGPELVLTMNAVERLRALLDDADEPDCKLRIEADGPPDDPEFIFSFVRAAGDEDIELDYVRVAVVLDPETRQRLRGREIDHRHDDDGEHFLVRLAG